MKQIINDINKKIKCEYQFDNIIDKVNTNNVITKISKKSHYKFSLMICSIFLMFLVIGSLLLLYLNDNSVKYEKYEFTETEEGYLMDFSGHSGEIHGYVSVKTNLSMITPYYSYHLVAEELGFYIVGYRNINLEQYQKNTYQYFKTITWYKFKIDQAIPSNIDNMEIVDIIAVVKERTTKDLFTNFEFELVRDKYIRCEYEVNNEEVKIIGDVPINEEYIAFGSRIHNQEEFDSNSGMRLGLGSKLWNVGVLLHWDELNKILALREYSTYYNIRTIDGQKYLEFKLYEMVDGELKTLGYLNKHDSIKDQLEQIKYKEITSNDGKYIIGLYPLNEVIKISIENSK